MARSRWIPVDRARMLLAASVRGWYGRPYPVAQATRSGVDTLVIECLDPRQPIPWSSFERAVGEGSRVDPATFILIIKRGW